MSAVPQRLVARLLDSAVRRWPAHLRDELTREWAAEVHALGQEPGVAAPVRRWRQLRFTASLAVARPPGADTALRWPSSAGAYTVWLLLAPLLTVLATPVVLVPTQLTLGWITEKPALTAIFMIETYLAVTVLAIVIGTLFARRFLRRRLGQPVSVAACAWTTLPLIGGLLIVDVLARSASQVWTGGWFAVIAALCLVVLLPPVAAGVAVLSGRGRRGLAVAFAVLSVPVVLLATMSVLVVVAGRAPASTEARPWWLAYLGHESMIRGWYSTMDNAHPIETAFQLLPGFVLATVVIALAHTIRLARPLPPALARPLPSAPAPAKTTTPERRDVDDLPAVARGPWWHRIALGGAMYSVLAWAVTLTYLTPNIGVQNSWPSRLGPDSTLLPSKPAGWPEWTTEEGRLWMHELQLFSIVCAALCLLCAAAYRGRPLLPTLAGSTVLLAVNMTVVRAEWTTPQLLPWLAAGGILLGMAAWWASMRLAAKRRRQRPPRRLVITITVLAAFLVPGSFFPRIYVVEGTQAPPILLLVVVGLPTILTILAVMGVFATSKRPPPGPAWRFAAGLALLPAVGGTLYFQDGLISLQSAESSLQYLIFIAPLVLAVPVAVWTSFAIRGRPASPRRLGQYALLAPPLLIAGLVTAYASIIASGILSRLLLFPMEYAQTYDGLAYIPGAVVLGLLLGHLTTTRLDPANPNPAPAPEGVTDLDHTHPGTA